MKRGFWAALAVMAGVMFVAAVPVQAADMVHRVVIHVDDNDKKRIGMALNNAQNIDKYCKSKGEKVEIEVVAYGPGLRQYAQENECEKESRVGFRSQDGAIRRHLSDGTSGKRLELYSSLIDGI